MKKCTKFLTLSLAVLTFALVTACGTNDTNNDTKDMAQNNTVTEAPSTASSNTANDVNDNRTDGDSTLSDNTADMNNMDNGVNAGGNGTVSNEGENMLDDAGNAVGGAVEDIADGVKNVARDMTNP